MRFSKRFFLSYAIVSHPLLAIIQMILLDYFHISERAGTLFHITSIAILMIPAIFIAYTLRPSLVIKIYLSVLLLLLINFLIFPKNIPFMIAEAAQFTLPIVIPCVFCLVCISDIRIFLQAVYNMSWFFLLLMLFYVYLILSHKIIAENYSMYLGYAALLPMLVLYQKKTKLSLLAFSFLFIYIVVWGNRGAAVAGIAYIVFDIFSQKKKSITVLVISAFGIVLFKIESFLELLQKYGIESRSINKIVFGGFDESEGRERIYSRMIIVLKQNLEGIGIWGDRTYLDGAWCHNLILEILLDYGVIIGSGVILGLVIMIIATFVKCGKDEKKYLLLFFCSSIIPLMFSNSYLRDYKFGIFIGILCVLYKNKQNIVPNKFYPNLHRLNA